MSSPPLSSAEQQDRMSSPSSTKENDNLNYNKTCCFMCGKKGTGLMEGATFQEETSKVRRVMEKIFEGLGLAREDISLVVFFLEKPQTLCAPCHSSMQTLLALQGEVTALEGVMRKYAVGGIGQAIRSSLGGDDDHQDIIRPTTPLDDTAKVIMWKRFQLPVLQNFLSGRIRVPSQDQNEDENDDETDDDGESDGEDNQRRIREEEEEDSVTSSLRSNGSNSSSPQVVVVKDEELEEGEVREGSEGQKNLQRGIRKKVSSQQTMRNRRGSGVQNQGEKDSGQSQSQTNNINRGERDRIPPVRIIAEPQIEITPTSTSAVTVSATNSSSSNSNTVASGGGGDERGVSNSNTARTSRNTCPIPNNIHPDQINRKRVSSNTNNTQEGTGSKSNEENSSKRQRVDDHESSQQSQRQQQQQAIPPRRVNGSNNNSNRDKVNLERRPRRRSRRESVGCGWNNVTGHPYPCSRRERRRREWRCERHCPLNITDNGEDMRRNLVEWRGETVKKFGFVPEREEECSRRGDRGRMGGRCVIRGCHAEGEWLDVPGLLHHIHNQVHLKGLNGSPYKK